MSLTKKVISLTRAGQIEYACIQINVLFGWSPLGVRFLFYFFCLLCSFPLVETSKGPGVKGAWYEQVVRSNVFLVSYILIRKLSPTCNVVQECSSRRTQRLDPPKFQGMTGPNGLQSEGENCPPVSPLGGICVMPSSTESKDSWSSLEMFGIVGFCGQKLLFKMLFLQLQGSGVPTQSDRNTGPANL